MLQPYNGKLRTEGTNRSRGAASTARKLVPGILGPILLLGLGCKGLCLYCVHRSLLSRERPPIGRCITCNPRCVMNPDLHHSGMLARQRRMRARAPQPVRPPKSSDAHALVCLVHHGRLPTF